MVERVEEAEQVATLDRELAAVETEIAAVESDLDEFLFALYGLTNEERRLVEGG